MGWPLADLRPDGDWLCTPPQGGASLRAWGPLRGVCRGWRPQVPGATPVSWRHQRGRTVRARTLPRRGDSESQDPRTPFKRRQLSNTQAAESRLTVLQGGLRTRARGAPPAPPSPGARWDMVSVPLTLRHPSRHLCFSLFSQQSLSGFGSLRSGLAPGPRAPPLNADNGAQDSLTSSHAFPSILFRRLHAQNASASPTRTW